MSGRLEALRVDISSAALEGVEKRARARLRRIQAAKRPRSGAGEGELLRRNLLGLAGEQAVLAWLRSALGDELGVRDAADAHDGPCDLEVTTEAGALGIEVKATTYEAWYRYGRSITEDQLYDTDAEVYVWCAGPRTSKPAEVHIVGWSTTADVRRASSQQLFTGRRDQYQRQVPVMAATQPDGVYPEYGLDDPGFDEHEWNQAAGLPDLLEPEVIEARDALGSTALPDGELSALLIAHGWPEGSAPRPGFGPSKAIVRANSTIRPLSELADWIKAWQPES